MQMKVKVVIEYSIEIDDQDVPSSKEEYMRLYQRKLETGEIDLNEETDFADSCTITVTEDK